MDPLSILISTVLAHVIQNVESGITEEAAVNAVGRVRGLLSRKRNHDLEHAVSAAVGLAVKTLAEQDRAAWKDVDWRYLRRLEKDAGQLFPTGKAGFPVAVLDALLFADEATLEGRMWDVVGPWLNQRHEQGEEAFRDQDALRRKLPKAVLSAFGEVLKDPARERAWIAFERELLRDTHRLLHERLATLTAEQRSASEEVLSRLDALTRDESLLVQLARITAETLGGIARLEAGMGDLRALIQESASAHEDLFARLERAINRSILADLYAGAAIAERVDEIVAHLAEQLIGREEELARLDAFVAGADRGILAVTARAGFGKSTLLANWIARRRAEGRFTAYHCFSHRYDETRPVASGFRNLLRQIVLYYELRDQPLPADEASLRDTLVGLIRERGTRPDESLVIVIDALDEADSPFTPPLPMTLPAGVYVIVSVRAAPDDEPIHLRGWPQERQRLRLDRLSQADVAAWLRRAGDGELAPLADDSAFVAQLDARTDGLPLYLRYLIADLLEAARAGAEPAVLIDRTPTGLRGYVDDRLTRLAEELAGQPRLAAQAEDLFALLAVALGPIPIEDAQRLTGLTEFQLRALPWQVTRWFVISPIERTYAFAHTRLAEEFARALGKQAEQAREVLIAYCADWQRHRSPYALRHYAAHLRQTGQLEDLFALAQDRTFLRTQAQAYPSEPVLPLSTIALALGCAAECGEVGAVRTAALVLAHARYLVELQTDSPLEILRRGDFERARQLAHLFPLEQQIRWYLLLAWESKDAERLEESRHILTLLHGQKLPRHRGLPALVDPSCLLVHLAGVDDSLLAAICVRLLDHRYLVRTCRELFRTGDIATAQAVVDAMQRASLPAELLLRVGHETAIIAVGKSTLAAVAGDSAVLAQAATAAASITKTSLRIQRLESIASDQAALGDPAARDTLAMAMTSPRDGEAAIFDPRAFDEFAQARGATGHPVACDVFAVALALARAFEDEHVRTEVLAMVAALLLSDTVVEADDHHSQLPEIVAAVRARASREAADVVRQYLARTDNRPQALSVVATAQMMGGDATRALTTAHGIVWKDWRAVAHATVAAALAQGGCFDRVVQVVELIHYEREYLLPYVAAAIVEGRDHRSFHPRYFNALLGACAEFPETALPICGLLAKLYPSQAGAIAQVVIANGRDEANVTEPC